MRTRRIFIGTGWLIAAVLVFLLLSAKGINEFFQNKAIVEQELTHRNNFRNQRELEEKLLLSIKTAESSLQTYILTGDTAFRNRVFAAADSAIKYENQFYKLHQDYPILKDSKQAKLLEETLQRKIGFISWVTNLADTNNHAAQLIINKGESTRLTDTIEFIINNQLKENDELWQHSIAITTQAIAYNNKEFIISTGSSIILIGTIIFLLLREISKRKKLALLLKQQKDQLSTIFTSVKEGLITTNLKGEIIFANPSAEQLCGWTFSEMENQPLENIFRVTHEDTGKSIKNIVSRILEKSESIELENNTILHTKQASKIIISNNGSPLQDENGNLTGAVLVFRDVTERKKLEKEARDYRYALDESSIVTITNPEGRVTYANDNFCRISQYAADELLGYSLRLINSNHHPKSFFKNIWDSIERGIIWRGEIRSKAKDGSFIWLDTTIVPFMDENGKPNQYLYIGNDITERKNTEEKLKATSSQLQNVYNILDDCFWGADLISNKIIYVSPGVKNIYGYSEKEFLDQSTLWVDVVLEEDKHKFAIIYSLLKQGKVATVEFRIRHKDSGIKWLECKVTPALGNDKQLIRIDGITTDITERKQTEKRVEDLLSRYEMLAEATSDTIWDWDINNNKVLYNYGITKMLGYNITEVGNVPEWWKKNIHPEDAEEVNEKIADAFEKKSHTIQMEYRYRCADGTYKYILDRAFIVFDENKKPIRMVGAMQDLTYQKEEEIRMNKVAIEAQENERQQIGMDLHDNVNQILGASLLYLGMTREKNRSRDFIYENVDICMQYLRDAIEEIRRLSHQLAPASFDDVPLKEIVESLINSYNTNNHFQLKLEFNGIDSTDIPGELRISMYRILQEQLANIVKHANAEKIEINITLSENTIQLRITDNGNGFDLRKVKKGIGIENIRRRAKMHNGEFILRSSPGNGCEVVVKFPLASPE